MNIIDGYHRIELMNEIETMNYVHSVMADNWNYLINEIEKNCTIKGMEELINEIEELIKEFGEEHRNMIIDSILWLDFKNWNINKRNYIKDLIHKE